MARIRQEIYYGYFVQNDKLAMTNNLVSMMNLRFSGKIALTKNEPNYIIIYG